MWRPKKLSKCFICNEDNGRLNKILTQCDSYGHISYGVTNYNLCYWCYESIIIICQETPIDYLVSDNYHWHCQDATLDYDDSDRWTRKELERYKYFIEEHDIRHCNKLMSGKSTWTSAPKIFLDYRTNLINTVRIRDHQCNTITTMKLLAKEDSYLKYLPSEILSSIILDL